MFQDLFSGHKRLFGQQQIYEEGAPTVGTKQIKFIKEFSLEEELRDNVTLSYTSHTILNKEFDRLHDKICVELVLKP